VATESRIEGAMSLAEFLAWPRIDEKPYLEFHDGRIEAKVSPQSQHSMIQLNLPPAVNGFARPRRRGLALPELRCTFGGRSILPDIAFLLLAKFPLNVKKKLLGEVFAPPDIHVEVRSPGQSTARNIEKIEHSLRHGCPLGWFLDPDHERASVFRPGQSVEHLKPDGYLDGDPVLPGFRLAVAEVFGWLTIDWPEADEPEAEPS